MLELSAEKLEAIQSMTAFDDVFITTFFDRKTVEFLLRLILKKPELSVRDITFEQVLDDPVSKGVRLDIRAIDEAGNWMNIEFQIDPKKVSGKRLRYYHSRMDVQMLQKGQSYTELPDACVIFICRGDPIGKGKPMYCYRIKDQDNEVLDNGQLTLVLNADYPGNWEFKELMDDLKSACARDMHYDVFRQRMQSIKEKEDGLMANNSIVENYINRQVEERIAKRVEEQVDEEKSSIVLKMLKDDMPEEKIIRWAGVTPEFIEHVRETIR
ncbi:Rpn family recombination-promoting nuclease/putative transposase [Faecalibaculum rodentium]|uniref:Rpn family recombination-promoting nuclease/putative transposase n=1 Tax=Faecalibaculum rodentium TaxID=1702221 RepID=UPI0025A681B1|nr:Rpn family recombination-promoting nuclease/putative transposase [Faecalibaculum rodentium]